MARVEALFERGVKEYVVGGCHWVDGHGPGALEKPALPPVRCHLVLRLLLQPATTSAHAWHEHASQGEATKRGALHNLYLLRSF